jgi:hypothetical protein
LCTVGPFPSLLFLPLDFTADALARAMPASSGALTRARTAASGASASEPPHPAAATVATSTGSSFPHPLDEDPDLVQRHALHSSATLPCPSSAMAAEAAMAEFVLESTPPSYPHTPQDVPDRSWAAFCRSIMEQIDLLQSEIASSSTAEAQLREEILELRTKISILDAAVLPARRKYSTGEGDSARKEK